MFFPWFKRRCRQRLRDAGASPLWEQTVSAYLWQYARLSEGEQNKLRGDAAVLVAEKHWEGCNGLELDETMKLTVAAQIALLTLGFPEQYFDRVQSILLYPGAYQAIDQSPGGGGLVVERESARLGEAWYRGPVLLSWPDVAAAGRGPSRGHHLVVHEFAHQLDTLNGRFADGVPVFESTERAERWLAVTGKAYERLRNDCENGRPPLLDGYGATNPAEFFAVASEAFFQTPGRLARGDRALFEVLRDYYGQDPLRWDS